VLCDRISQTIDALGQVRLSVHGLQHTSPGGYGLPYGTSPMYGWGQGLSTWGQGLSPWGQGLSAWGQGISPWGLGHSPWGWGQAWGQGASPWAQAASWGQGASPWAQGASLWGQGISPYASPWYSAAGLTHTSPELLETMARYNDPYYGYGSARFAQTFPYAYSPVPGFVPIW
jgi:hypothetical protein